MKLREAGWTCLSVILAGVAICTILAMLDGEKVSAQGQEAEKEPFGAIFVKTDAMIPMRDGVKLHTEIYAPKNATGEIAVFHQPDALRPRRRRRKATRGARALSRRCSRTVIFSCFRIFADATIRRAHS